MLTAASGTQITAEQTHEAQQQQHPGLPHSENSLHCVHDGVIKRKYKLWFNVNTVQKMNSFRYSRSLIWTKTGFQNRSATNGNINFTISIMTQYCKH